MKVSQPPLLALHCMLANGRAWRPLARHLDRPLICPDLPGHGAAPDPVGDIMDHAVRLASEAAPDGQFDVVGHSFGGCVALRLMVEHPERIRRAVLIEPVLFAVADPPATTREMTGSEIDPAADPEGALAAFTRSWGEGTLETKRADQRAYLLARLPLVYAANAAIFEDAANIVDRLPEIPITLVYGSASPPVMQRVIAGLSDRLPIATSHQIPGAAHMLPLTHAADLAKILQDSLPADRVH